MWMDGVGIKEAKRRMDRDLVTINTTSYVARDPDHHRLQQLKCYHIVTVKRVQVKSS